MIPFSNAAKVYYDTTPDGSHKTGDIWKGLPAFGLLGEMTICSGLVITPACDLANNKSSTITYLPIISVPTYLSTLAGYSVVRTALIELLQDKLKVGSVEESLARGVLPSAEVVEVLESLVAESKGDKSIKVRTTAGLLALRHLERHSSEAANCMKKCLSTRDWRKFRDGIVTNSFSDDVHFLPAEKTVGEWSAVSVSSVVLFRYPMTVPRSFLDRANDGSVDWKALTRGLSPHLASVGVRPLRALRMQKEFLSDLLTRFARLYVRIGSRDFTTDAVDSFGSNIDKECE